MAHIRREEFLNAGAEMMLVTSNRGLSRQFGPTREYETVLLGRPVPWADWLPCYRTYQEVKQFRPDVVVTEMLSDPRWRLFAGSTPRINLVHDAEPHDEKDERPWWNHVMFDRWNDNADATIAFSDFVASSLIAQGKDESRLRVAPLHSDLDPALVPPLVPANERKNFIMFGRQHPYKNHGVIFAAWAAHVASRDWRGDELIFYGDGEITQPLPPHARWVRGQFNYADVVDEFSRAKGSLVHHTEGASQSGVQLLSMQLGVPTLVSTGGALPEFQPDGLNVTGINDVDGLTRAINTLADPVEVDIQSRIMRDHYENRYDVKVFAKRFLEVANEVADGVAYR
ncbi:glycosyltransferase [Mycobacterium sp. RTGN5]|uniref:glycosyltransferase n=1 Tax=Mycobacterium sp. RTGN5 TaxID=3016522 RepID=UPI0029C97C87|nr:glycosyltransferase [Mycobacterium sp. RTGN5]